MSEAVYKKAENSAKRVAKQYDKAKYAEKMKKQREELFAVTDKAMEKIQTEDEAFQRYLLTQSRFNRYSVNNAALVAEQFPEATELHSYGEWRQLKVYVDDDATKILVLEAGDTYTRADGKTVQGFDVKTLYDISQTSAKDELHEREPKTADELLCAIMDEKISPVRFEPIDEMQELAVYNEEKKIVFLKRGQTQQELLVSIPKEAATALFNIKYHESREESTFKSYCVAYMLLAAYGMDVIAPTLPEDYMQMTAAEFKSELSAMRSVNNELRRAVYESFERQAKEAEP